MLDKWLTAIPRPIFRPRLALQTLKYSLSRDIPYDLMRIFGVFGLIHTPLIYMVGLTYHDEVSTIETTLRAINFILCLPLIFIDQWPVVLHRIKKYYWLFTVTFVLPFFATFMFIFHNGNRGWFTKITVALLWMVLVTNWSMFLFCLILGGMSGVLVYGAIVDSSFLGFSLSWAELFNSFWIVIIAGVFSLKRDEIARSRIDSMRSLAGAIAHEMRTPLFGIRSASTYLSQKLPKFIEKYKKLQHGSLSKKDQFMVDRVIKTPDKIDEITRSAFSIIDMLLTNLKGINGAIACNVYSVNSIISAALEYYPLSDKEKEIINFKVSDDCLVCCNKDLLVHVLCNLIKNSLYHIKEVCKGEIYIWVEKNTESITIIFKDTGKGISEKLLPFIFEPYYSSTKYGTGVGLHFCKQVVEACSGKITCCSVENMGTTFRIELKQGIDDKNNNNTTKT